MSDCPCLTCTIDRVLKDHFKKEHISMDEAEEIVNTFGKLLGLIFDTKVFIALAPRTEEDLDDRVVN